MICQYLSHHPIAKAHARAFAAPVHKVLADQFFYTPDKDI